MKQRDIGFRELLERVLPLEDLSSADRWRVQHALSSGVTREIEDAALSTLERLAERGALLRVALPPNGGDLVQRFQPRDTLELITLRTPAPEAAEGVIAYPRSALPTQVVARLDQVRELLRLDDPTLVVETGAGGPVVLGQLAQAGRELLGESRLAFLPLVSPEEGAGRTAGAEPGTGAEGDSAAARPFDRRLADQVLARPGVIRYCPDTRRAPRLAAAAEGRGVRSLAVVAVVSRDGSARGTLEVSSGAPDAYRADDLARIALLADYCGELLDRAERVEKLAFVDALTAAYNRAYFDLQAQNELARARRDDASVALCIADIDDFKSFNTAFGYEAGNQVLQQVAQTLRRGVRPFDTVARWGGEEFGVLLVAPVQADAARAISERLRASVERLRIPLEGLDRRVHHAAVTVSIGVALFPEHADTPQDLWRAANRALLAAKSGSKNQVIFFRPPPGAVEG